MNEAASAGRYMRIRSQKQRKSEPGQRERQLAEHLEPREADEVRHFW